MKTIWKAELAPADEQEIAVPVGSEMLCAREQQDKICVWFRCDPSAPKEMRKFTVAPTGHQAPADGRYLGTASLIDGQLIFHVFCH